LRALTWGLAFLLTFAGLSSDRHIGSVAHAVDIEMQDLREALEVQRRALRQSLQKYVRAPGATAFGNDAPGTAFRAYLDRALQLTRAAEEFPQVAAALRGFDGKVDPGNELQQHALGAFLGDYMQVRYGDDIVRELRTLVEFRTFGTLIEPNAESLEFKKTFQALEALATSLGLQVRNHANETLEITLPASGAAASAPAVAFWTHVDVMRPVEHKWDEKTPPFALTLYDGRYIGLGAYSNKGSTILALFALRTLRDAKLALSRPVKVLVAATANAAGARAATNIAVVTPKPALVLAADGVFPYASGEKGNLLVRVSSRRGMKTRQGIKPGQFYVHKMTCNASINSIPAEARAWVMYEKPKSAADASQTMLDEWQLKMKGWQERHPETRFATYIQDDTLHFFAYGVPSHAEANGRNAVYDLAEPLTELGIFKNSAGEILAFIANVFGRDATGGSAGLGFTHPEMGHVDVHPVQFDRLADEITVYIDVRWPVGHDAAWARAQMQRIVDAYNAKHGTALKLGFEPGEREARQQPPPAAVAAGLVAAFELASGAFQPPPAPVSHSAVGLLPDAIPFGPEWPGIEAHAYTRHESISPRELSDIGVAFVAALAWFGSGAAPVMP
jgi:acetylornithine deacetylase/succinyl-diaminopimelate desuccinylase-like protein